MPVAPVVQPNGISEKTKQSTDESTVHHLIQSVFTEVLAEFRDWKVKHSEQFIRSLAIDKRDSPVLIFDSGNTSLGVVDRTHGTDGDSDTGQTLVLPVTSYSADGTPKSTSVISLQVIHAEVLEPHKRYESCCPISRNIFRGDDDDRMAFIPFADDATFDHVDHTLCYGSLAWQEDYDPDCEFIPDPLCDKVLTS